MAEPLTLTVPAADRAERPVVRDAVRRAVAHNVDARIAEARRVASAPAASTAEPSPELARLLAHLKSTLTSYVRGRRADGMSVDRVLTEARLVVREAESCEGWLDPSNALAALVLRWSIVAYNDAAEDA